MTLRTLADKTLPLESRRPSERERGLVKDQLPSLLSSFRLSSDVLHSVSYHFKFVANNSVSIYTVISHCSSIHYKLKFQNFQEQLIFVKYQTKDCSRLRY